MHRRSAPAGDHIDASSRADAPTICTGQMHRPDAPARCTGDLHRLATISRQQPRRCTGQMHRQTRRVLGQLRRFTQFSV